MSITNLCSILGKNCSNIRTPKEIHATMIKRGFESEISSLKVFVSSALILDPDYAYRVAGTMSTMDVSIWNNLMRSFAGTKPSLALNLLSKMIELGVQPSDQTFPMVLKVSRSMSLNALGYCVTKHIIANGLENDAACISSLYHFHAKRGDINYAHRLFDEGMLIKDKSTWLALMGGYAQRKEMPSCHALFENMPMQYRDTEAWNVLIGGFARNDQWQLSLEIYRRMMTVGIPPDDSTMVHVLSACTTLGRWDIGRKVYRSIPNFPTVKFNVFLGNTVINFLVKNGSLNEAIQVFYRMSVKNVVTWNTIIMGCGQNFEIDRALEFLGKMDVQPNEITFLNLLQGLSKSGRVHDGVHIFKLMVDKYGIEPNQSHRSTVIDLLSSAGQLEDALKFAKSIKTTDENWLAMLSACLVHKNLEVAEYVFKELVRRNVVGDGSHFVNMANIYAGAGDFSRSEEVRRLMTQSKFKKQAAVSVLVHNPHGMYCFDDIY